MLRHSFTIHRRDTLSGQRAQGAFRTQHCGPTVLKIAIAHSFKARPQLTKSAGLLTPRSAWCERYPVHLGGLVAGAGSAQPFSECCLMPDA
ncbi:hypothetical protein T03_3164 [Trichinella britovi]|uniref:Uncharacterized protein n=1 Tax=Trichinella britovi TaxID=45882 RepID=A0A0V1CQP1_TRIBR|nr:hypothetical protein T03_3164 [Trichinella britovi]